MKPRISLITSLLLVVAGCALFQGNPVKTVYNLSYAASSFGASTDMQFTPGHTPSYELAWSALDRELATPVITGQKLRDAIALLPIKELKSKTSQILIQNGTFLFDLATGGQVNIETNIVYINSFARGVHDGLGSALGKTNAPLGPPILQ